MHMLSDSFFKGRLVCLSLYIHYILFYYTILYYTNYVILRLSCIYIMLYVEYPYAYNMQRHEEQWWRVTLRPSALQSEMGHPWSRVEKGHAPLLMCLYHWDKFPGQSSLTCATTHAQSLLCCALQCWLCCAVLCHAVPARSSVFVFALYS